MRATVASFVVGLCVAAPAAADELVLEPVEVPAAAGGLYRADACPREIVCFHATTPEEGWEPWIVRDGRAELLADLRPGPEGSNPSAFVMHRGVAWFSATVAAGRTHLFRYDGQRLTLGAIVPEGVAEVLPLPLLGGAAYFLLKGPVEPKTPGRAPEGEIVRVGPGGLTPLGVRARFRAFAHDSAEGHAFDGGLWLTGEDDEGRGTLWFFDGRTLSVVHQASTPDGRLGRAQVAGSLLVFHEVISGDGGRSPRIVVHVSDGRHVRPVQGFDDEGGLRYPEEAAALGDEVFVVAYREDVGSELFRLRRDHLELVADVHRGAPGSQPRHLTEFAGALWFSGRDARGFELRRFDGSRVRLVRDFCRGMCDGSPSGLRVVGDSMWFFAKDGAGASRAWRLGPPRRPPSEPVASTDRAPAPRRELRRIHRAVDLFAPEGTSPRLVGLGGVPHFTSFAATERAGRWDLQPWRIQARESAVVRTRALGGDRTGATGFLSVGEAVWLARNGDEGPRLVPATDPEGAGVEVPCASAPQRSVNFRDDALFLCESDSGRALFAFDGLDVRRLAAAGGALDAAPGAVVGGRFHFAGRDEAGLELHSWDGLRDRRVVDLVPGPGDGIDPAAPVAVVGWRDDVWFVGTTEDEGAELVRWSPSEESATRVVVRPGSADGVLGPPVVQHDVLWFPGAADAVGAEPFVIMSPDAVPRLLVDLNPGPRSSSPSAFTAHAGGVYFAAEVVGLGRELFRVAGREGEVELVRDLGEGVASSAPRDLLSLGEALWFIADTPEGAALWVFSR